MTGVMPALKPYHGRSPIGQQIYDLALAFIPPLGPDYDDILAHDFSLLLLSNLYNLPRFSVLDQFAITTQLGGFAIIPGQGGNNPLTLLSQLCDAFT
jgi:hypothetical protein